MDIKASETQALLKKGGFDPKAHPDVAGDIAKAEEEDPGCWRDMAVTLNRMKAGSCRTDEWDAPLDRRNADLGELKRRRGQRLYRLFVRASRTVPNQLDLLHFGWKRPGKAGLAAQDGQIDVAYDRMSCL